MRRLSLPGLLRSLVLPLLLLLAQQGAQLHELRHYAPAKDQQQGEDQHAASLCALCLGFAQLQAPAGLHVPPLLLAGLSFARVAATQAASRGSEALRPHNRGPPVHD